MPSGFGVPCSPEKDYRDRHGGPRFNPRAEVNQAKTRVQQLVHKSALFVKCLAQALVSIEALGTRALRGDSTADSMRIPKIADGTAAA